MLIQQQQASRPIEEDDDIFDNFWYRRLKSTNKIEYKSLYANADAIIEREGWSFQDMKDLSAHESEMYKRTCNWECHTVLR